ncbi:MAG: bifunctional alpha/beta hydrolase/OsmC family protein [Hyphomicrobiaceae bacterium]|nr:bifunctional alpha/beta hydrolase/OsmC family protein [Hyphomicrobiaceae bacterium]
MSTAPTPPTANTSRLSFPGALGHPLAARIDRPPGTPRAYALFAHCFTCSKDLAAARGIAQGLAAEGIAVVRFDFTGLGHSGGEFANTNFSSNVQDLVAVAEAMRRDFAAPTILIGHSLGGAAVLAAAGDIPEVKAVATIGAPADVAHVLHQFGSSLEKVASEGQAEVRLGGRPFTILRQFVEDASGHQLADRIRDMRKALLVLHAPLDATVGIDNATAIFAAAKHPKSFVSLDHADHLVTNPRDAAYAARVIAAWAARFLPDVAEPPATAVTGVRVEETGAGKYQNAALVGRHRLLADEPTSAGGLDSGPNPYDFLSIALGACTSMTLRMYAEKKGIALPRISVDVSHAKVAAAHCEDCTDALRDKPGRIDRFERVIRIDADISPELEAKLVEIAGKCPVHRTLEQQAAVHTTVSRAEG